MSFGKPLLETNPFLKEILVLPKKKSYKKYNLFNFIRKELNYILNEIIFVLKIKNKKYDVVIDGLNTPRTALLSFLSRAKIRISFSTRNIRNAAFTNIIPRTLLDKGYIAKNKLLLLQPLGIVHSKDLNSLCSPKIFPQPEEVIKVSSLIQNLNLQKFIVLSPTSKRTLRQWEIEKFVSLGEKIIKNLKMNVVWIWGPGEEEFIQKHHSLILERISQKEELNTSILMPLISLREASVLFSKSQCFVGVSNGLSHIACASGGKTLQIHGPTNAVSWTHPDTALHRSVQNNLVCVSCEKHTCRLAKSFRNHECMTSISAETVFTELCNLLVPIEE
jgi:ADP-heptose:LPS heptosyltransferase